MQHTLQQKLQDSSRECRCKLNRAMDELVDLQQCL